ncbi:MAG: DegT/DnrJ/EryC1/StrS aminotransferase family protein [Candidatus Korobacteraceae bacterium]|jgi:perosamine synthetase
MYRYPVYRPWLCGNEKQYVNECLESTWISSKGHFVGDFERAFASYIGARYAGSACNGTAALHLTMLALGIGAGAEVIVPTLTYVASVNAITYTGATPIFVDSLESTWQMDPADVRRKITQRTRAIMAVHLYGHPCEMHELASLAKESDVFLIEDCAESFGSLYNGRQTGTLGDIAAFSFFGNKTITTGEGGMVTTNDETLFDRVQHFKGQGLARHREYWHDVVGYNYRMTNICAAIGLAQLEQADRILERKRQIAQWYRQELSGLPVQLHAESAHVRHSYWMCSIIVSESQDRDPLREALSNAGIETRPLFYPVHSMPMYAQRFQRHPVAEHLGWCGMNLPSYPDLSQADVAEICGVIRAYFSTPARIGVPVGA